MTKFIALAAISTIGLAALSSPVFADHHGYGLNTNGHSSCVLGTNMQPGTCVGPVHVAPVIMAQGHQNGPASGQVVQQSAYTTTRYTPIAHQAAPLQMAGCVQGYAPAPGAVCNGNWVRTQSAPTYQHAAPVYQQVPVYLAAPVNHAAPMMAFAPRPASQIANQITGEIPTSFFTGGITYGAGFPTENVYNYGGGGYIVSGGGPRFSGVRERAPFPLTPPARKPRPAPKGPGHCCH